MAVAVVLVFKEKVLVGAVSGESDGGGTEAGQGTLKTVPSGERALVSPGLTGKGLASTSCPRGAMRGCESISTAGKGGLTFAPKDRIGACRWLP